MAIPKTLAWVGLLLAACGLTPRPSLTSAPALPDVVIFVADDMADSDFDVVSQPSQDNPKRGLPNLVQLAANGARFTSFYAHAWCAPARDSLLRSVWAGVQHGEWACGGPVAESLDLANAYSLPRMMRDAGYRTATIGKWHSGVDSDPANAWEQAPSLFGFDDTVVPWPVPATCAPPGSQNTLPDFSARLRDGFLSWWTANEGTPRFAMVSFEAAHSPWSFPIASLLPAHYPPPPALRQFATDRDKAEAEMVGMDTAIGSMLAVLGPEDIVIFLGDNGTSEGAVRSDQDPTRVKLTCYEDGVRVPFIISGPSIPAGSTFDDISHVVDILPTLRGMLGLQGPPVDGAMLTSQAHDMVFCHGPDRLDAAAISAHWKLLTTEDGTEHLFDRFVDPLETAPISATGPIANYLRTRRIAALGH